MQSKTIHANQLQVSLYIYNFIITQDSYNMESQDTQRNLEEVVLALNQFYLLIMGVIVFSMQLGFTLLEAGGVRKKNVNNILTKVSSLTSLTPRTFSTVWSAQFATG
jgi:hypothetical protein